MHESFQNNINWNVPEESRKMPKSVQFKIWKQIYEHNIDRCTCNFNEDKDQIKENKLYNSQFQNWFLMQLYLNKVRK